MLADRGYRVGESTYAEWESGYKKQPAKDAIPHLVALWGGEPPPEQPEATETRDAVVANLQALTAAMTAQAEALQEIVAEMRLARAADQGRTEGLAAALGDLAGTLERLRLAPLGQPE